MESEVSWPCSQEPIMNSPPPLLEYTPSAYHSFYYRLERTTSNRSIILMVTSHDWTRYEFCTPFSRGCVVWDVAVAVGCFRKALKVLKFLLNFGEQLTQRHGVALKKIWIRSMSLFPNKLCQLQQHKCPFHLSSLLGVPFIFESCGLAFV